MAFSGRKFSINRHTGVPKPFARRSSVSEPGMNGKPTLPPRHRLSLLVSFPTRFYCKIKGAERTRKIFTKTSSGSTPNDTTWVLFSGQESYSLAVLRV